MAIPGACPPQTYRDNATVMGRKTRRKKPHEITFFGPPDPAVANHYLYLTQRPWPSLVFILPMLLVFEVGTYVRHIDHPSAGSQLVAAYLIDELVTQVGRGAFYFPGLLTVVILLAAHLAARHPWRFDLFVLAGMLGESLIWTVPLFVFDRVLHTAVRPGPSASQATWADHVIRSLGAGIYEELVFRLIAITALVIILADICKLPRTGSAIFAMLASAALFAAQHHPPLGADPFNIVSFLFRTAAGLYLAGIFVFRGFGIAAGTHAAYDIIVVTISAI